MQTTAKRLGSMKMATLRMDISERQGWKLMASGRFIRPIRIGRSVKIDLDELDRWIDAGCPNLEQWEAIKTAHVVGGAA